MDDPIWLLFGVAFALSIAALTLAISKWGDSLFQPLIWLATGIQGIAVLASHWASVVENDIIVANAFLTGLSAGMLIVATVERTRRIRVTHVG